MEPFPTAKSILVIDDEPSILKLMKRSLTKNGYNVDTASNGEEGIKRIEANDYSLILTDIKMPGISGNQVFDYLHNKTKKTTAIVGMSGTPWFIDQRGFDAVLQKPSSQKEMLDLIRQFVEK
jgi:CheY-like chemotaxis protein